MTATCSRLAALILLAALGAGCHGPGHVEFTGGQCIIDGRPATLAEVEARQARISERILSRQPLFVIITVLIVVLAGFSHIEKLLLLFSTRREHVHGLTERLRLALERYRAHPLRYFVIVVGTLSLLGIAGGCYVYLDADKRASERALSLLQFCHLALRNSESETILAEQRRNLQAIESTAGNIRTLVDKLPPAEQRKAKEIVAQINQALAQQGKLVSDYATRNDESARAVRAQTESLQKGLTSLGSQVLGLKSLPSSIHELSEQIRTLDGHIETRLTSTQAKLDELMKAVDTLANRPPPKCAPEVVASAPAIASAPTKEPTKDTTPPAKTPGPTDAAKTNK
jgi:hypothetical protein